MFWSGNYIAVRELNLLLKEENVSLGQVLEAEDILQECKANNKVLIKFLTRPEILAELVTLITEEPPQDVDLLSQYRHASIACEVLTSQLWTLSDHLSMDMIQMHRLCDFINREPPLNPLLSSYFSKTIEMLLERNPQQDWYQYHITCLRVLDFLKSRRDFLPNLLRHISTSAIADTFKYFIRIADFCHKNVQEWLEENQFLECLIQIICGTYVPEPLGPPVAPSLLAARFEQQSPKVREQPEKADTEESEKTTNHREEDSSEDEIRVNNNIPNEVDNSDVSSADGKTKVTVSVGKNSGEQSQLNSDRKSGETDHLDVDSKERIRRIQNDPTLSNEVDNFDCLSTNGKIKVTGGVGKNSGEQSQLNSDRKTGETDHLDVDSKERIRRIQAVASANAASLLCDIILTGCSLEGCSNRHTMTALQLVLALRSEDCVREVLGGVFTAPPHHADAALLNGCRLLLALLQHGATVEGSGESERTSVEVAMAPHLPLLHQALIRNTPLQQKEGSGEATFPARVGEARLYVAAVVSQLAASQAQQVANTLITLGTPGALVELVFRHPDNNLLHAHALALLKNALDNSAYRTQYARHLLVECDLLTRLMDAFEENEAKKCSPGSPRAAYMGYVILMLSSLSIAVHPAHYDLGARLPLPPPLLARWRVFYEDTLRPLLQRHDTPLGGSYPSENVYDMENMVLAEPATYDFNDMQTAEIDDLEDLNEQMCTMPGVEAGEGAGTDDDAGKNGIDEFKKMLSSADKFSSDMWEDDLADPEDVSKAVDDMYCSVSPWDSSEKSPNTTQKDCSDEAVIGVAEQSALSGAESQVAAGAEAGWASFDAFCDAPVDPFTGEKVDTNQARMDEAAWAAADKLDQADQWNFWNTDLDPPTNVTDETTKELDQLELDLMSMKLAQTQPLGDASIELANNLLTAMSSMAPSDIANIVNANLPPPSETAMSENRRVEGTMTETPKCKATTTATKAGPAVTQSDKDGRLLAEDAKAETSCKESASSESRKTLSVTEDFATENVLSETSKSCTNEPSILTQSTTEAKTAESSRTENKSSEPSEASVKTEVKTLETPITASTTESNNAETSKSESTFTEAPTTESAETSTTDTSTSDYNYTES